MRRMREVVGAKDGSATLKPISISCARVWPWLLPRMIVKGVLGTTLAHVVA